jgi:Uma2 family endonuclease
MGQAAARAHLPEAEYLAFERASPDRHEYADGEIFAMSGGTGEHSAIAANLISELRSALFGRGCRVHTSDMRIKISATRYVYPDASALCASPEYTDDTRDTLVNPRVIVEVLSDSTEAYDRGDKFAQYQTIPSLAQYVLASQKKPRIEVFTRQADGSWLLWTYGPGERAALSSVGCTIEVDRVYTDVLPLDASADAPAG